MSKSKTMTTVCVSYDTRDKLNIIKYNLKYKSINDVIIEQLLLKHETIKEI